MKSVVYIFFCVVLLLGVARSAGSAADISEPNAMRRMQAATVQIRVEYAPPFSDTISWGTGFVVGPGLIMTNAHVVSDKVPTRIFISSDFLPRTEARVVGFRYDTNGFDQGNIGEYIANAIMNNAEIRSVGLSQPFATYDVALLAFEPAGAGTPLPVLSFADRIVPGEPVYAIGYPGPGAARQHQGWRQDGPRGTATPFSVTTGRVNQIINGDPRLVMHSALSRSGNSGGPLLNARGEVVGMQTWSMEDAERGGEVTSFALATPDLTAFMEQHGMRPTGGGLDWPARRTRLQGAAARDFVLRGVAAGNADFMALAGMFSFLGDGGFARDDNAAVHYLTQALSGGAYSPNAYLYQAGLAAVLSRSPGLPAPYRADQLLRSANNSDYVDNSSRHPDYRLLAFEAGLYMQGGAGRFPHDPNRSMLLAEKAMEGAFAIPLALTGFHYYFGDSHAGRNHALALEHAREAARNGVPEGYALLAHLYYDSDVVPKTHENLQLARSLAERAASMGDVWGMGLLANILYESGTPQGRTKAYELAVRAADGNNRLALYCLGRMAWDAFLANPADISLAAKAWSVVDLAERRGVRVALPDLAGHGGVLTSARALLSRFSPDVQQRLLAEGEREQRAF